MGTPFEELSELDKLIHEPARLAILTALSTAESIDFMFLQRITGLNKGNLSIHLSKLEAANLVRIDKEFVDRKPRTEVRLTEQGRKGLELYWMELDRMREDARKWKPSALRPKASSGSS